MRRGIWSGVLAIGILVVVGGFDGLRADGEQPPSGLWPLGGRNVKNTRHQRAEHRIDVGTAAGLQVQWVADTDGDISATPAVDESSVYVPDNLLQAFCLG